MTEDEFTRRFTKRLFALRSKKNLPFGYDPGKYAADVMRAYWLGCQKSGGAPERYVREDAAHLK